MKILFLKLILLSTPFFVYSENLEVGWPDSPMGAFLDYESTIADLIVYLFEWGVVLSVTVMTATVFYLSLQYMTSMGSPDKINLVKERLASVFAGLMLLMGSWIILNLINPELTQIQGLRFIDYVSKEIDISGVTPEEADEKLCDYVIVSYYTGQTETRLYTFIERGEFKGNLGEGEQQVVISPFSSLACKKGGGNLEDDLTEEGDIKFSFARIVRSPQPGYICPLDCAADITQQCEGEIRIDWEDYQHNFCYDRRGHGHIPWTAKYLATSKDH